jgi:hypothetical protein
MWKIKSYFELLKKANTYELKYNSLKEQVKEDTFKNLMNKIGEPEEIKRLRAENKRLRIKLKEERKKSESYMKTMKK